MRKLLLLPIAAILFTGCAANHQAFETPNPLQAPSVYAESAYSGGGEAAKEIMQKRWWETWNDPLLNGLVEKAVEDNLDLKIAAARVRELRSAISINHADLLPTLSASASGTRAKSGLTDTYSNRYSLGLSFSWEVDVWKRIEARERAAVYDMEAAHEENLSAYQTIVSGVVRNYVEIVLANRQVELALSTVENDEKRLEIIRARFDGGLAPSSDVYLTEQTLAETRARVNLYKLQAKRALHSLNILLGRYPATPVEVGSSPFDTPPEVPVGIPSDLLMQRPDIRAALSRVRASDERIAVSKGNLMPKFTISGGLGREAAELGDLLDWERNFWNLVGNVFYPIFNNGKLEEEVTRTVILKEQAILSYGKSILTAYREVEDALASEREEKERLDSLMESASFAALSLEVSESRYIRGLDNLIPSLNARKSLYSVESAKIDSQKAILLSRIALHQALGGVFGHEEKIGENAVELEK